MEKRRHDKRQVTSKEMNMTTALTKAGFWRKTADSSSLREPRVLIRVYVGEGEIDRTIAFYEQLHGVTADMRFDFPEHRLVLAAVGPFLILEGRKSSCALSAAPSARYWSMTFILSPAAAGRRSRDFLRPGGGAHRRLFQCAPAGRHDCRVRASPAACRRINHLRAAPASWRNGTDPCAG